jgi:hypothetical protein
MKVWNKPPSAQVHRRGAAALDDQRLSVAPRRDLLPLLEKLVWTQTPVFASPLFDVLIDQAWRTERRREYLSCFARPALGTRDHNVGPDFAVQVSRSRRRSASTTPADESPRSCHLPSFKA